MTNSPPLLAVILVHYGKGLETTLACLESLFDPAHPALILVIDQNEDPDLLAEAQARLAQLPHIHTLLPGQTPAKAGAYWHFRRCNQGYGGGMNLGVQLAQPAGAELCLLLNNDVLAPPQFAFDLVSQLQSALARPDFGMAGCLIRYLAHPGIWFSGGRFDRLRCMGLHDTQEPVATEPFVTGFLTGCCLLVKTADYLALGGMAEEYFLYFEDVDLGLRMQDQGKQLWLAPCPELRHEVGSATGGELAPLVVFYSTRNRLWLMRRRTQGWGWLGFLGFFLVSRCIRLAQWTLTGRWGAARAMLRGLWQGVAAQPDSRLRF